MQSQPELHTSEYLSVMSCTLLLALHSTVQLQYSTVLRSTHLVKDVAACARPRGQDSSSSVDRQPVAVRDIKTGGIFR